MEQEQPPAGAALEANFDGIVGPTHNYAGLSPGNVASQSHAGLISRPRDAVKQGLMKARRAQALFGPQYVLPPQYRPEIGFLRAIGFEGTDQQVLEHAATDEPRALAAAWSASAMWAANAATVSPSADTRDGRVHFTPANLCSNTHRFLEGAQTARTLRAIFNNDQHFCVHEPLPGVFPYTDEGAANHTRFCTRHEEPGVELFVYGCSADEPRPTKRFPARQGLEACRAIARRHGLDPARVAYAQQNPGAIDQGVFHNDVIAVGYKDVLLCHEHAWVNQRAVYAELCEKLGAPVNIVEVNDENLTVEDAVRTYLFNSQLGQAGGGGSAGPCLLFAPTDVQSHTRARAVAEAIVSRDNPIGAIEYADVRESMRNGGGPACLRLRVVLTREESEALPPSIQLDNVHDQLTDWADRRYREELAPADLVDPALIAESRDALDELTAILGLGSIYPFQR